MRTRDDDGSGSSKRDDDVDVDDGKDLVEFAAILQLLRRTT